MKVVPLRDKPPLTDIVGRLRRLADDIEAGEQGDVPGILVLIPRDGGYPTVIGYGDVEGENHPIIQFELGKTIFVNNIVERGGDDDEAA
jgi:hypothetical protein